MPKIPSRPNAPRNPVARSPLLRKGGVHEKGQSAQRQQHRNATNTELDNWREDLAFERSLRSDAGEPLACY